MGLKCWCQREEMRCRGWLIALGVCINYTLTLRKRCGTGTCACLCGLNLQCLAGRSEKAFLKATLSRSFLSRGTCTSTRHTFSWDVGRHIFYINFTVYVLLVFLNLLCVKCNHSTHKLYSSGQDCSGGRRAGAPRERGCRMKGLALGQARRYPAGWGGWVRAPAWGFLRSPCWTAVSLERALVSPGSSALRSGSPREDAAPQGASGSVYRRLYWHLLGRCYSTC